MSVLDARTLPLRARGPALHAREHEPVVLLLHFVVLVRALARNLLEESAPVPREVRRDYAVSMYK